MQVIPKLGRISRSSRPDSSPPGNTYPCVAGYVIIMSLSYIANIPEGEGGCSKKQPLNAAELALHRQEEEEKYQ